VVVLKEGKILFGKRKSKLSTDTFGVPGGHLEYMESFEDCARREVREETGIEIQNIRFLFVGNTTHFAPKHFVNIGLVADWKSGELQNLEPDKCEGWEWYDMADLPKPLMYTNAQAVDAYKTGKTYYDVQ
jgi:8-oxo-dGTP diphosphatase